MGSVDLSVFGLEIKVRFFNSLVVNAVPEVEFPPDCIKLEVDTFEPIELISGLTMASEKSVMFLGESGSSTIFGFSKGTKLGMRVSEES